MARSLEGNLIKKAHAVERYTLEEINHLEACLDPVNGPLYFCKNFLKIQHPRLGNIPFEPYGFQVKLIQAYHERRQCIAMLPRQMGKALSLDTPIFTPSGFVTMGNLKIGDTIYGPDGLPTTVTFITDTMHNRECYLIKFTHGDTITADAEHLWTWYDPYLKAYVTDTTVKLLERFNKYKNSSKQIHIQHSGIINIDSTRTHVDPYYFGTWLGNESLLNFKITCTYNEYIDYNEIFKKIGLSISEFKLKKRSYTTGTFIIAGSPDDFKYLTFWATTNHNSIPAEFIYNSVSTRISVIQGLMDANGIVAKNGVCRLRHSSKEIIEQVRLILSTLGVKSTITSQSKKHSYIYTIRFATTNFDVFRLKNKLRIQRGNIAHTKHSKICIESISPTASVPVRCLQVNNTSRLFLAGNTLIPTHNTTCAVGYLLWYTMFIPESQVLIAAHKQEGAHDIMNRYRFAYENLPNFIRAGVYSYNRHTIEYDNGARIQAVTTTENTGRGKSLSLIYCLDGNTTVKIRNKHTLIEEDISLKDLYNRLDICNMFVENNDYEIFTPNGWKHFNGIRTTGFKKTKTITIDTGEFITATPEHKFFINNTDITVNELCVGMKLDTKYGQSLITNITDNTETEVFDIVEVEHEKHQFFASSCFITSNCDELSFIDPPEKAREFWTALSPTLSTGGKCIITSTPNSDEDQFAVLWNEANKRIDEYGNETELGANGFYPFFAPWSEHPDRDEEWAALERSKIGVARFKREFDCVSANSIVTLQDENGKIFTATMGELHDNLL